MTEQIQILTSEQLSRAVFLENRRLRASSNDSKELLSNRVNMVKDLSLLDNSFKILEMYPFENEDGVLKSREKSFSELNQFNNTRTKLSTETILEIDKLPLDKAVSIICEVCLSLIRNKIHFSVYYAEGSRSPYVVIFDFEELKDLTEVQQIKAQILFWKSHVPTECFQYIDTGIFEKNHYRPLEFAPHWKHGTPFNLLFEYEPTTTGYKEIIAPKKFYSKLRAEGKSDEEARRMTNAKFN